MTIIFRSLPASENANSSESELEKKKTFIVVLKWNESGESFYSFWKSKWYNKLKLNCVETYGRKNCCHFQKKTISVILRKFSRDTHRDMMGYRHKDYQKVLSQFR